MNRRTFVVHAAIQSVFICAIILAVSGLILGVGFVRATHGYIREFPIAIVCEVYVIGDRPRI